MSSDRKNSLPFRRSFQVCWGDLDANQHMANTAYMNYCVQGRFLFFSSVGFGTETLQELGIGLAAVTETITYRKELRFLDRFDMELLCGGSNAKNSKYLFVNNFLDENNNPVTEVRSLVVWFDLVARKAVPAPRALAEKLDTLAKTEDFKKI